MPWARCCASGSRQSECLAVIALDTNVLVRCLTQDDPSQVPVARRLLGHAVGVFIGKTVLLETEWVLRAAYAVPREHIHTALLGVCGLPNVVLEQPEQIAQALADYAAGLDFADALHAASSQADEGLRTFDQRFAKAARARGHDVRPAMTVRPTKP